MRNIIFISALLAASLCAPARTVYTPGRAITSATDTVEILSPSEAAPLRLYAAEVRCAMPSAASGRHKSVDWSVSWLSGQSVTIGFDFEGHTDGTDRPVAVVTVTDGLGNASSTELTSGIDFHGGPNTLCLEWREGVASIFAGKNRLEGVTTLPMECPSGPCLLTATSGAQLVDAAVEAESVPRLDSGISPDSIDSYLEANASSLHPLEGVWQYLDRDTDPALALEGGRYRLAIIASAPDSLRIIYLGGAVTNAASWRPGMVKGSVTDIAFTDHFTVDWLDAMTRPMGPDCYCTLLSPTVLTFTFPNYSASLRFRRIK